MTSILPLLLTLFPLFHSVQPMLISPEEQQEKVPQFWSFFLHPGNFKTSSALPLMEKLQAQQQQEQVQVNTSEQGKEDYYDAAREEDEREKQQQQTSVENATDVLDMMAALRMNVDPLPVLAVDGSADGNGKQKDAPIENFPIKNEKKSQEKVKPIKQIVFPPVKQQLDKDLFKTTVDDDTYDDERAELGQADEEINSTVSTEQMPKETIVILPDTQAKKEPVKPSADGDASSGESSEEDGDDYPFVDGATGDGAKQGEKPLTMPPKAQIFGTA